MAFSHHMKFIYVGRKMHAKSDSHVSHSKNDKDTIKERQMDPHSHAIILDPFFGKIAFVPDLGMDLIRQLVFDPTNGHLYPRGEIKSGEEHRKALGPRYIEFHPTLPVAYVVNELSSEVAVFRFNKEKAQRNIDMLANIGKGLSFIIIVL
jgi:6-phosphogluconolactonase (cycloisomerase 2 family)